MRYYRLSLILLFLLFSSSKLRAQLTVNITQSPNPYCSGNAQLCANISGGVPPYFIGWFNGESVQCINYNSNNYFMYLGPFTVYVEDSVGNFAVDSSFYITPTVYSKLYTSPETCNNQDGKAWLSISGGTQPYTISWSSLNSNTIIADTFLGLSFDNNYHYYSVEDANGCIAFDTTAIDTMTLYPGYNNYEFIIEKNLPYNYNISTTPHDCPQLGTAKVDISGGVPPYSFEWSTTPPQYTDSVGGLYGGWYEVTISDNTPNCSVVERVRIQNLSPLNVSSTYTDEVCDFNNGTATVIPSSGTPPYTYTWNTSPVQNTATASNLTAGEYNCTIIDANQCSRTRNVNVRYTSPVRPNAVVKNEICSDGSGNITLIPQLGTPPYTFQWSDGSTADTLGNLRAGIYSFTVNDAGGCSVTESRRIQDKPPFSVNITFTSETCLLPGTATANVTGNTGPVSYEWSTNPVQTTSIATGLSSGSYYCTVTDTSGCESINLVNISYDPLISANLYPLDALCLTSTGGINCSVIRGQSPYSFKWSNGDTTKDLRNVVSGYYSVTITDSNNCQIIKSANVKSYSNIGLAISSQNATCIFTNDGQASVNVSNGVPPYSYQWGNGDTTQTITGLSPNWNYGVVVSDANGCTATKYSNYIGYDNLSCAVQVFGKVVKDLDADCTFSLGDEGINRIIVNAIPGYHATTNSNGDYSLILPEANYALNHRPPYHTFQRCPEGSVTLFGMQAGEDTVVNFYDTVRTALDLSVGYGYLSLPRPGFTHQVSITCRNLGNVLSNALLEYEYDEDVELVSAPSNFVHDPINRKLSKTLTNFYPNDLERYRITFVTPDTIPLGTKVKECVLISPIVNDVSFVNNTQCDSVNVVSSFDPNDKRVTPQRDLVSGTSAEYINTNDSVLHYRIRFQNTGTYYAENVVIRDTLDASKLDLSSIERVVASHDFRMKFYMNKYLTIYFDQIFLPDSFTNEPESHGFVSFFIKRDLNLPHETEIDNRAAIYFDYNKPIITNTAKAIVFDPNSGIEKTDALNVNLYPNPTENQIIVDAGQENIKRLTVNDISGKQLVDVQSINTQKHQLNLDLEAGIYLVQVYTAKGVVTKKMVVR